MILNFVNAIALSLEQTAAPNLPIYINPILRKEKPGAGII